MLRGISIRTIETSQNEYLSMTQYIVYVCPIALSWYDVTVKHAGTPTVTKVGMHSEKVLI
jgi:hypothetical protein